MLTLQINLHSNCITSRLTLANFDSDLMFTVIDYATRASFKSLLIFIQCRNKRTHTAGWNRSDLKFSRAVVQVLQFFSPFKILSTHGLRPKNTLLRIMTCVLYVFFYQKVSFLKLSSSLTEKSKIYKYENINFN